MGSDVLERLGRNGLRRVDGGRGNCETIVWIFGQWLRRRHGCDRGAEARHSGYSGGELSKEAPSKAASRLASADLLLVTDREILDPQVSPDIMEDLRILKRRTWTEAHSLLMGRRESVPSVSLFTEVHDYFRTVRPDGDADDVESKCRRGREREWRGSAEVCCPSCVPLAALWESGSLRSGRVRFEGSGQGSPIADRGGVREGVGGRLTQPRGGRQVAQGCEGRAERHSLGLPPRRLRALGGAVVTPGSIPRRSSFPPYLVGSTPRT